MDLKVVPVDLADESALRAWWQTAYAATRDRPFDAWPSWEMARRVYNRSRADRRNLLWRATDGGETVGAGQLMLFELDNPHLGFSSVWVLPDRRRAGIGRALHETVETAAHQEGRTTLIGDAVSGLDQDSPAVAFAEAMGYWNCGVEHTKVLDLPSALTGWDALAEEATTAVGDYRLHVLDDAIPDDLLEPMCVLLTRFLGEIPLGDLDIRPAEWTPERIRAGERDTAERGGRAVIVAAVAPDGAPAGFTDLRLNVHDPARAEVGGTLVLPEHRGRRLGMAMKLASHRHLAGRFPDCRWVVTGNAGVNTWMNGINERLGYRVVERCLEMQRVIDG